MPITHDFQYYKPSTMAEALKLLSRHKKASILAGGTDVIPEIKEGMRTPDALIDIKGLSNLREIKFADPNLLIGSLATFADIIESKIVRKRLPVLIEVAKTVGSVGIRNRATMAGNICSAVPCMDSGPILRALDVAIIVKGIKGQRKIKIADWFLSPRRTALKPGELVLGISIPVPSGKHGAAYVKLGRYAGEDLAQASVFVLALPGKKYKVAFGSVGPVPIRAVAIEGLLDSQPLSNDLIQRAKDLIPDTVSPITDVRASKEYRLHMCQVMFERGLRAAVGRLAGNGPDYGVSLI